MIGVVIIDMEKPRIRTDCYFLGRYMFLLNKIIRSKNEFSICVRSYRGVSVRFLTINMALNTCFIAQDILADWIPQVSLQLTRVCALD